VNVGKKVDAEISVILTAEKGAGGVGRMDDSDRRQTIKVR
jgi:hypothetical protein